MLGVSKRREAISLCRCFANSILRSIVARPLSKTDFTVFALMCSTACSGTLYVSFKCNPITYMTEVSSSFAFSDVIELLSPFVYLSACSASINASSDCILATSLFERSPHEFASSSKERKYIRLSNLSSGMECNISILFIILFCVILF